MALLSMYHYLRPISTVIGLITATVLLGVGVDMAYHRHWPAIVTLGSFIIVCVLEVTSIPEACFHAQLRSAPAPLPWQLLVGLRDGKRALLYAVLALLVLLTSQHRMWLTALSGVLLFLCSGQQLLLAYIEWKGSRRRDRTCLLEEDDFEDREDDGTADIVTQSRPQQI